MDYCPLESAMRLLGGRWKLSIICALHHDKSVRFNELKRKIRGITNTMLSNALKELEDAALISRTQYPEMPVRVEYRLTRACDDLLPILSSLNAWSIKRHR